MRSTLASWNTIGDQPEIEPPERALIVGYDAVGGFFAINGGAFEGELGHVFYFGPDTLEWQSLGLSHSNFLRWTLSADFDAFYTNLRWPGWEAELAGATGDQGFSLCPPPFTKEGQPVSRVSRKLVPMSELWLLQCEYVRQLADVPGGASFRVQIKE